MELDILKQSSLAQIPGHIIPIPVTHPLEPLFTVGLSLGLLGREERLALAAPALPPGLFSLPMSQETLQLHKTKSSASQSVAPAQYSHNSLPPG